MPRIEQSSDKERMNTTSVGSLPVGMIDVLSTRMIKNNVELCVTLLRDYFKDLSSVKNYISSL